MPWVHQHRPIPLHLLHEIVRIRHLTLGQEYFTPYNTPQCRRLIMPTHLLSLVHRLTNRSTLTLLSSSANMTLAHPIAAAIIQLPILKCDRSSLTMGIHFRQPVPRLYIPRFLNTQKPYHPRYATVRLPAPVSRRLVNISLATDPSSGNRTIPTLLNIDQNG